MIHIRVHQPCCILAVYTSYKRYRFRSLIAHEARSPPPRQPALARHSPHRTSHRNSCPTHPRTALLTSPPAQHAPRSRLPCPAQPTASSHCEHPNSICPAYPPLALHDPSPAREPVSRSMSPLAGPWVCPAPAFPKPSLACQPVRYLSGIQLLCSCGRGLSTQAIAVRVRPATLDESAAASLLASPMGAGTHAVTHRLPAYMSQGCSAQQYHAVVLC